MSGIFRILPDEGVLHLLTRGNNRKQLFKDDSGYNSYLNLLKRYKQENNIIIYHYCLMPNHVHLIVAINPKSNISRFVKQLNLSYLQYFGKKYSHCGHLWQGRFKSLIISEDGYLITCGRYIESNPVKAQLVKKPEDYRWSSYNLYAYGQKDSIVTYNPIYLDWGRTKVSRQRNYRESIEENDVKINFNARFLGSDEFVRKMEKKFRVKDIKTYRGRPRKPKK